MISSLVRYTAGPPDMLANLLLNIREDRLFAVNGPIVRVAVHT